LIDDEEMKTRGDIKVWMNIDQKPKIQTVNDTFDSNEISMYSMKKIPVEWHDM